MRYDVKAIFTLRVTGEGKKYDPVTGEWVIIEADTEARNCWAYDMTTQQTIELYGRQDVQGITISHQGKPINAESVEINGRSYKITSSRQLRRLATYIAYSERSS